MIELNILCEGPSEREFVRIVLGPHLREMEVFCKPIAINQKNFGAVSLGKLRQLHKCAIGASRPHQYTTTLIDLYALPDDYFFPEDRLLKGIDLAQKVEKNMAKLLPSERWIPHVQLHEFEAMLFVDLTVLAEALLDKESTKGALRLREQVSDLAPEEIDQGPQTSPSKRIGKYMPSYSKGESAALALREIGITRLRSECPHFSAWVSKLEELGQ